MLDLKWCSSIMDLDLNQEPADLVSEYFLNQVLIQDHNLESTHDGIEGRMRQLEAVYSRARWQQIQNHHLRHVSINNVVNDFERKKRVKRESSHLVAKALGLDIGATKAVGDGAGFFDCNICFDKAKEPILTCCGHLFCWACFYRLPYDYSTSKECPVCKGEVSDSSLIPVYGQSGESTRAPDSGAEKIPPRPKANRIESVRQNRVSRRVVPVVDALRRIRVGLGSVALEQVTQADTIGSRRLRSRLVGRALSEVDSIPRVFELGGEYLMADQVHQVTPPFGFEFDSPVIAAAPVPAEVSGNESHPPPNLRRSSRRPRLRRPRPGN